MILRLENVTKRYGKHKALDGLSVEVRPGAVGLLGPNGAGKSTLIKALLGLVGLTEGQAWVLGNDVRRESRRIREQVGYMPEDDCIVPGLSGVEAVAFSGELAGLPRRTALRRAHEMLDYCFIADERYREVQTYSTGMRQKVRLAQAIIHAPKLVFLDEPTSGLDPEGRERMLKLIRDLSRDRGISVIVSTHILKDVEVSCDSILMLAGGKLLVYDELESLQQSVDRDLRVRYRGDASELMRGLESRGLRVEEAGREELRLIRGNGDAGAASAPPNASQESEDDLASVVFRLAHESGVVVREIAPSRTSLEDVFLEAVRPEEGSDADS